MTTFGSIFGGGEGAGIGARAAGLTPLWSIEQQPDIAAVAELNGFHSLVADARAVDYTTLPRVDWLHTSPPCINASVAKADAGETALDGALAEAVCRAIRDIQPATFSLENVIGYRHFDSYAAILAALTDLGYSYEAWTLNASNYGVPQTRKRLILLARRGTWHIQRPEPTHVKGGDMWLPAWIGWYEAIEDLLPTLPESAFADWQLARLGPLRTNVLAHPNADNPRFPARIGHEPAFTVATFQAGMPRAFLMRSQNARQIGGKEVLWSDAPAMTITAEEKPRAFLVGGANTSEGQAAPGVGVSDQQEPSRCVNASNSIHSRAWLSHGRVVALTPRALARLMSVPDSYMLPPKASLACRVLGNMVTPLMMQRIVESVR